jgi:hypothetical protein
MTSKGVPWIFQTISIGFALVPYLEAVYFYLFKHYTPSEALTMEGKRIIRMGNMILLLHAVSIGAVILSWVCSHDDCYSDECGQDFPKRMMPLRLASLAFISSIGMPLFFPCRSIWVAFLSIFITQGSLIISALLLNISGPDMIVIFASSIVILFAVACYDGMIWSVYTSFSQFESALRVNVANENKEYLMKTQTEEMCNMIGIYVLIILFIILTY